MAVAARLCKQLSRVGLISAPAQPGSAHIVLSASLSRLAAAFLAFESKPRPFFPLVPVLNKHAFGPPVGIPRSTPWQQRRALWPRVAPHVL